MTDAVSHNSTPRAIRFPPGSKKRFGPKVEGDGGAAYRANLKRLKRTRTKDGQKVPRER